MNTLLKGFSEYETFSAMSLMGYVIQAKPPLNLAKL